jgi:hypothetical protein
LHAAPEPIRFLPYREARQQPHIVVDGAPLPSTTLTLSHWPNNSSPPAVRRDTSTATVFAWLAAGTPAAGARFVTNNHFDEDGLFSVFALCDPQLAAEHRTRLIDASFAGDFGVVRDRDAARLCFAIESLTDPATSTLPAATFTQPDRVAALYRAMLQFLPELLQRLPACERLWAAQDAQLLASRRALADATVTIEERADLDLAIVRIPPELPAAVARRYLRDERATIHPFAINTATAASRVLRVQGRRYEFQFRYESWVQLASRRVPLRVELAGLAARLNELEGDGRWVAEPATEVAPRLWLPDGGESRLPLATFLTELSHALRTAPVAWDPYDWQPAATPAARVAAEARA